MDLTININSNPLQNRVLVMMLPLLALMDLNLSMASTPVDTFRLANEAFHKGAIEDALQLYQSIADKGFGSLPLYYNLGSAYASQENWGHARYYLEKAHREDPLDPQVLKNLNLVKDEINDPYRYPKYPLFTFIELLHSKVGHNFLSWIILVLFLLLLVSVYLTFVGSLTIGKPVISVILSLFLLVGALLFFEQMYERFHNRMVIAKKASPLYLTPDEEGKIALDLQHGHKLRIQEVLGPWYRVDLADGTEGWIPAENVRSLKKG